MRKSLITTIAVSSFLLMGSAFANQRINLQKDSVNFTPVPFTLHGPDQVFNSLTFTNDTANSVTIQVAVTDGLITVSTNDSRSKCQNVQVTSRSSVLCTIGPDMALTLTDTLNNTTMTGTYEVGMSTSSK